MKKAMKRTLLAMIPTLFLLFFALPVKSEIYGIWYDHYTNTKLEIKRSHRGIKVKHHGGFLRKWRRYIRMGRGLYDDCDGRAIVVLGRNEIKWKRGRHRRPIILTRKGRGYYGYGRNSYDRYDDYYGDYYDDYYDEYQDDYRRNPRLRGNRFFGDWYCSDRGLNLSIQEYGNGFRAYHKDRYTYYEPFDDHYRDSRGNRYYIDDDELIWRGVKGDQLKFRRR